VNIINFKTAPIILIHPVYIYIYIYISEQTVIISRYDINWFIFIADMHIVYFLEQTQSLNIIQVNLTPERQDRTHLNGSSFFQVGVGQGIVHTLILIFNDICLWLLILRT